MEHWGLDLAVSLSGNCKGNIYISINTIQPQVFDQKKRELYSPLIDLLSNEKRN
jgi:hypothetical protein